jgi:hypothetical protein
LTSITTAYGPLKYRPGIGGSFDQRSASLVPEYSQRTSTKMSWYETIVEHQSSICWDQLIFGRWSTLWATHQSSYLQRQKILPNLTSHGTGWTSRITTLIWTHCHNAWLDRNQALHDLTSCPIASRQFRIRSLYDLRNQCSQFVCNCWFYPSQEDHFSRVPDPTQLENWLALNEARNSSPR